MVFFFQTNTFAYYSEIKDGKRGIIIHLNPKHYRPMIEHKLDVVSKTIDTEFQQENFAASAESISKVKRKRKRKHIHTKTKTIKTNK